MIKTLLVMLISAHFCAAAQAAGAPVSAAPEELKKIAKDIEIAKENLEIQEIKQRKVLAALYSINKNLKKLVGEKGDLEEQKSMVNLQIESLNKKISEQSHQTETQKAQLADRLRAIYKLGGPNLMRFVFSSGSSADLERNLKILGIVAQRDLRLIKNYRESMKDLEDRKHKLNLRLASLKEVEIKLQTFEKKLQTEVNQKNRILSGIRRTKMFTQDQLKNLKDQSLAYDLKDSGLMDMLLRPSFEAQKGVLPRPVQGPVRKSFGLIKAADQPYVLSNKGLLIGAAVGSPVRAVFSGIVSFVGSLPGLGKVLILDHGDHYYTVYGNNENVRVQLGQEVAQSQVIAGSGYSSFDQQNGLYFEVRHFSEPYNPMEWVKGLGL